MKMDNVRAFQRELEEMGVSPKSVETRIAEAVAAEREAIIAICMEAGDTALANKCGEIAGAMYVTVARIRARAGEGEQVPMSDNPNCET